MSQRFPAACKLAGESFLQFSNRLRILLNSYLHSRDISDMAELIELLLTDKFKDSLTQQQRGHIGDQEQEKWFTLEKIAKLADFYVVNHPFMPSTPQPNIQNRYIPNASGNRVNQNNWQKNEQANQGARPKLSCTVCSGIGHDAAHCFKVIGYPNLSQQKTSNVSIGKQNFPSINKLATQKSFQGKSHNNEGKTYRTRAITIEEEQDLTDQNEDNGDLEDEDNNNDNSDVNVINRIIISDTCNTAIASDIFISDPTLNKNISSQILSSKNSGHFVSINIGSRTIPALVDSGAQISCLHPDMLPPEYADNGYIPREITLQGPFGEKEKACLLNISAKLIDENTNPNLYPIVLNVAITDKLASEYMILSIADYSVLLDHNEVILPDAPVLSDTNQLAQPYITNHSDLRESQIIGKIDAEEVQGGQIMKQLELDINFDVEKNVGLKSLQENDPSLATCFKTAKQADSKFFIDESTQLLYRNKVIGGLVYKQLLVPESKRELVLKTAHDALWSNHLGTDKTLQRIQSYFYWPSIGVDVANYVKSCIICQKKTPA